MNILPQKINTNHFNESPSVYLTATNFIYGEPYKFNITLEDLKGNKQVYLIKGFNLKRQMKRVK